MKKYHQQPFAQHAADDIFLTASLLKAQAYLESLSCKERLGKDMHELLFAFWLANFLAYSVTSPAWSGLHLEQDSAVQACRTRSVSKFLALMHKIGEEFGFGQHRQLLTKAPFAYAALTRSFHGWQETTTQNTHWGWRKGIPMSTLPVTLCISPFLIS